VYINTATETHRRHTRSHTNTLTSTLTTHARHETNIYVHVSEYSDYVPAQQATSIEPLSCRRHRGVWGRDCVSFSLTLAPSASSLSQSHSRRPIVSASPMAPVLVGLWVGRSSSARPSISNSLAPAHRGACRELRGARPSRTTRKPPPARASCLASRRSTRAAAAWATAR